MTLLSVIADVAVVVGLEVPDAVAASTLRERVEMLALANEMAQRIGKAHDWTALRTIKTLTGDGTTTAFPLPTDYWRMLKKAQLWSSTAQTPLTHVVDTDRWLEMSVRAEDFGFGAWTVLGGNIEVDHPPLANAATAKFYYVSNLIVIPATGSNKAAFSADDDVFRLGERSLKLGMIWQWKANKGQAYAEDMANYEGALAEDIGNDQGSRVIRVGRVRMPSDVRVAYPQSVGN